MKRQARSVGTVEGLEWWVAPNGQITSSITDNNPTPYIFQCAKPPVAGTSSHALFLKVCKKAVRLGIMQTVESFVVVNKP